jgi:hypothetical protein
MLLSNFVLCREMFHMPTGLLPREEDKKALDEFHLLFQTLRAILCRNASSQNYRTAAE